MILAGDIGGTKTNLGFFTVTGGELALSVEEKFPSREHASLDELVKLFLSRHTGTCERACFAVAGPVRGGRSTTTNLPWIVDAATLSGEIGRRPVDVINDLEATAYAIAVAEPASLAVIRAGDPASVGNEAVIAAGTGLGEAGLIWNGARNEPFACEGGHCDFAPGNDLEVELYQYLRAKFQHVAWERVLSGPGLVNLYTFLRDTGRGAEPAWLAEEMRNGDPAAAVSNAALAAKSPLCEQALELFVSLYGAEAGNLALKMMAAGGVYVGGGIAPRILAKLQDGTFERAFLDKGRMRGVLESMPIRVLLDPNSALIGAARYAALRA